MKHIKIILSILLVSIFLVVPLTACGATAKTMKSYTWIDDYDKSLQSITYSWDTTNKNLILTPNDDYIFTDSSYGDYDFYAYNALIDFDTLAENPVLLAGITNCSWQDTYLSFTEGKDIIFAYAKPILDGTIKTITLQKLTVMDDSNQEKAPQYKTAVYSFNVKDHKLIRYTLNGKTESTYSYDSKGNLTSVNQQGGNALRVTYDSTGKPIKYTKFFIEPEPMCPSATEVYHLVYDSQNRLKQLKYDSKNEFLVNNWSYKYADGKVAEIYTGSTSDACFYNKLRYSSSNIKITAGWIMDNYPENNTSTTYTFNY